MAADVSVCVVGAGRAGRVHAGNCRWRVPHARLAGLVDLDPQRARQAAADEDLTDTRLFDNLEQALETAVDAVIITTPTYTHAELAVTAAQAGVHVFCEKPMALTVEDCDRMIDAASRAGVLLQIGFMRRFDDDFVTAKRQIEEGVIGRPVVVRTLTRGPGLPPTWARDPKTSNGMLAEVNSHDFDTIRWLAAAEFQGVYARAGVFKAPELRGQYPDFYDTAVVTLELESGAFGLVEGICPADYGYDARTEVVGSEGVLLIGGLQASRVVAARNKSGLVGHQFLTWRDRFRKAYIDEASHFIDCIRRGQQTAVGGPDGRAVVRIVLAANESIKTGRRVSLDRIGDS